MMQQLLKGSGKGRASDHTDENGLMEKKNSTMKEKMVVAARVMSPRGQEHIDPAGRCRCLGDRLPTTLLAAVP